MDKLKKQFLGLQESFNEQKPFIKKKIERWESRGRESLFKQARLLFNEAEICEKEIASIFEGSDWKYNRAFLKVKLRALDGLLLELNSLMSYRILRWIKVALFLGLTIFVLRNFVFGVYYVPSSSAEPSLLVGDRVWCNKLVYFFHNPTHGDLVMFNDPLFSYEENKAHSLWQRYIGIGSDTLGVKAGPRSIAKRVIACPGDVIEGRIEGSSPVIYLNGKKLDEPYVNTYPLIALKKETGFFEREKIWALTVPEFLRKQKKIVLYSYDPKRDFEEQPFYFVDYRSVLYDQASGYMKVYKAGVPAKNSAGEAIDVFGPYIVPTGKYWVMGDNRRNSIDSREWGFVDKSEISGRASFVIWSLDSEETFWGFELIKSPVYFFSLVRWGRVAKKVD